MPALLQAFLRLVALKRLGVLLFVLAATLCASSTASALEPTQTKTCVWGFDFAEHNSDGLLSAATHGKHQGNRAAPSEVASGSLLAPGGGANIVYRGLAAGEDAAAGLVARSPGATNSVASHVAGARASQWISTTRSLEVATSRFGQNGVVAIDLSKVGTSIVDLTQGIPGIGANTMLSRWAINAQEVLIQGSVPADAITFVR